MPFKHQDKGETMAITTVVFDAYGTLLDVNSAARRLAEHPEQKELKQVWPELARIWRDKQLQYTWLRAVTDRHCDFWQVTQDSLDWTLEKLGLNDPDLRQSLLDLYLHLDCYPEVPHVLSALKQNGFQTAILSNGTPELLRTAVTAGGIGAYLDALLSVETVGVYKPDARVYDMVGTHFSCQKDQVLFISSNGWDAAGAAGYGFQTAWINRIGDPVDRLYATPQHTLPDLTDVPNLIEC